MPGTAIKLTERRSAKRVPLKIETRIRHSGLEHGEIMVGNLSFTGFKGETDVPLKRGDLISIDLPNIGLVRATVKWRDGRRVAGAFHGTVDVRACFRRVAAATKKPFQPPASG